jgi:DNA replication protein DnaC
MTQLIDKISSMCTSLKLSGILQGYQAIADKCAKDQSSYTEYLASIMEYELECRAQNGRSMVLKMAGFPTTKTLEMFDFTESSINKAQINELATLRFMSNAVSKSEYIPY